MDKLDTSALYRIEWNESPATLIEATAEAQGSILLARGDGNWVFRIRFNGYDKLPQFHNYIIERELSLHIPDLHVDGGDRP